MEYGGNGGRLYAFPIRVEGGEFGFQRRDTGNTTAERRRDVGGVELLRNMLRADEIPRRIPTGSRLPPALDIPQRLSRNGRATMVGRSGAV
jgi:hypothetical protein